LVESGVGSPTNEWVLVGVIGSHELGTPERVKQLEKMKQRKTDHGEAYLGADVISVLAIQNSCFFCPPHAAHPPPPSSSLPL